MRIVLVGPPGAGKGTQAKFISAKFDIPPISTGEIFRANVSAATEMGVEAKKYMDAGDLVPDEVTVAMVRDRLAEDDTVPGFLLDGFPRTVPQAVALTKTLDEAGKPLDVVLELRMDDEQVIRRLAGRRTCRKCSHLWHLEFDPPKVEGVCDLCGSELFQRDDDMPETISRRLDVYAEQTQPLLGHYAEHGLLVTIEATGSVDEVAERAIAALRQSA